MYIMCMRCVGFASCVVYRCGVLGPRAFSTQRMTLRNGTALKELHTLIEEACDGMAYQPVWGRIVKFSTGFQLWKLPLICEDYRAIQEPQRAWQLRETRPSD